MLTGLTFFHMTKITHLTTLHDSISYTPRVLFNFPLQEKPTDTPTHKKKGKNKSAYTYYMVNCLPVWHIFHLHPTEVGYLSSEAPGAATLQWTLRYVMSCLSHSVIHTLVQWQHTGAAAHRPLESAASPRCFIAICRHRLELIHYLYYNKASRETLKQLKSKQNTI